MYNIINACSDLGVHVDGSDKGPLLINNTLRSAKISNRYIVNKADCIKEKNHDNLKKNIVAVNQFSKELYKTVEETLNNNLFPITIGGDHTIAISSVLASLNKYKDEGIIWIDAHSDFNTFETTETGNIHGLPLAAIIGLCPQLTEFITNNYIKCENCIIIGARSIDKEEMNNLKKHNIKYYSTINLKEKGINNIMDEVFNIMPHNVHISYDLDIIDPSIAPGVSVPESDGISEEEAYQIMNYLITKKDRIKSLDLVEYNPSLDRNNHTLSIASNLLNKFIDE